MKKKNLWCGIQDMKKLMYSLFIRPILMFGAVVLFISIFSIPVLTFGAIGYLIDNNSEYYILLFIPFFGLLFKFFDYFE